MTDPNPVPLGDCTCPPGADQPCDYCQAMARWAHEELYGHEEPVYRREEHGPDWDWDDAEEDEEPA